MEINKNAIPKNIKNLFFISHLKVYVTILTKQGSEPLLCIIKIILYFPSMVPVFMFIVIVTLPFGGTGL